MDLHKRRQVLMLRYLSDERSAADMAQYFERMTEGSPPAAFADFIDKLQGQGLVDRQPPVVNSQPTAAAASYSISSKGLRWLNEYGSPCITGTDEKKVVTSIWAARDGRHQAVKLRSISHAEFSSLPKSDQLRVIAFGPVEAPHEVMGFTVEPCPSDDRHAVAVASLLGGADVAAATRELLEARWPELFGRELTPD